MSVDGNDTVSTSEAINSLKVAGLAGVSLCHQDQEPKLFGSVSGITQIVCLQPTDPSMLLRKSDVDGCVDRILAFPCQETVEMTSLYKMFFATMCPMKRVRFLSSHVSYPFQGNITTSDTEDFWYGCM